jgi:hypothetical protein
MNREFNLEKIKNIPMFFILGRPRTGSTLLRTLFDAHPSVIIPQEWPMLLLLQMQFGQVTFWDKAKLEAFYDALFQPLRIPAWSIRNWPGLDSAELRRHILECEGNHRLETLIRVVYWHYSSFFGKTDILLIGDKNPATSNHPEMLIRMFPEAKFIHLLRDYRDNLVSMLGVDFEMPNVGLLTYRWKYSFRVISKAARKNPDQYITLRYEDLVRHPEEEFGRLCRFLDLPVHDEIFSFHERKAEIEASYPPEIIRKYFSSLLQPINTSKVGIYRSKLSQQQIRIADLVVGDAAGEAGYERDFTRFSPADYLRVAPAILYTRGLYLIGKMVRILPFSWMLWLINKPSVVVKIYTRLFGNKAGKK